MSRRPLQILLSLFIPLVLLTTACGDDPAEPTCAQSLCSEGETRCLGNVLATCEKLDGQDEPARWRYESCGTAKACTGGAAGQSCETRKCTNLGGATCDASGQSLYVCDESGMTNSAVDCGDDEVCAAGTCAPGACEAGETRCGYRATLTCVSGLWEEEACGADEICVTTDGAATCADQVCEPEWAWCEDGVAHVCNHDGTKESTTKCGENLVCNSGFCESLMCNGNNNIDPGSGVDPPDAVTGDAIECEGEETLCLDEDSIQTCSGGLWVITNCGLNQVCGDVDGVDTCKAKAAPPLETIGVITFDLAGTPNVFDLNARADYISADSMLKISGASGTRKIELNFAPIEPLVVGQFTDTSFDSDTVFTLCYYDGGLNQESPGCTVGFSHSSTVYTAVIDEWNGIGSSVVGTFEATLEGGDGSSLAITEGVFDVKQK